LSRFIPPPPVAWSYLRIESPLVFFPISFIVPCGFLNLSSFFDLFQPHLMCLFVFCVCVSSPWFLGTFGVSRSYCPSFDPSIERFLFHLPPLFFPGSILLPVSTTYSARREVNVLRPPASLFCRLRSLSIVRVTPSAPTWPPDVSIFYFVHVS